jgi:uncharacterized membrane protein (UPF0127 family)
MRIRLIVAGILAIIAFGVCATYTSHKTAPVVTSALPMASTTENTQVIPIVIGGHVVAAEVADSPSTQKKGLGGHAPLEPNQGMWFVFKKTDIYPFWMKDMSFAIDIIWVDANGTIVDIWQNATPDTYPNAYKPARPAKYVLEVSADFTRQNSVHVGDKVIF